MELSLIISLVSIAMSIYLFTIKHYRELYKIGITNEQAIFDDTSQTMFVKITFVNESSMPFTIIGLTITKDELQYTSSELGQFIPEELQIVHHDNHSHYEIEGRTSILPIVIAPYSEESRYFAFSFPRTFKPNYFLEVETTEKFLVVPFNPVPKTFSISVERHGRVRSIKLHWRQHKIRTLKDFIASLFQKRTWFLLTLKIKTKYREIRNKD